MNLENRSIGIFGIGMLLDSSVASGLNLTETPTELEQRSDPLVVCRSFEAPNGTTLSTENNVLTGLTVYESAVLDGTELIGLAFDDVPAALGIFQFEFDVYDVSFWWCEETDVQLGTHTATARIVSVSIV